MDSLRNSAHAHILDFPIELMDIIAEYVSYSNQELLHLRATCRDMASKTERVVARRYFSDRAFFILNEESLETLSDISEHPVFAKSIRRIAFSFATLHATEEDCEIDGECAGHCAHDCPPRYSRETRSMRKERREMHQLRLDYQAAFFRYGFRSFMLQRILSNFVDCGNAPALVATGQYTYTGGFHTKAYGYARVLRELGGDSCLRVPHRETGPFRCLLDAIESTGFPITHLEIGCLSLGVPLRRFSYVERPFSYLKTLRVCIASWPGDERSEITDTLEGRQARGAELMSGFYSFLWGAPNLETLAISCDNSTPGRNLSRHIFWAVYATAIARGGPENIQVLELARLEIDFPALLNFVEAMSKSLRCLKLHYTKLYRVSSMDVNVEKEFRAVSRRHDFTVDIERVKFRRSCGGVE